MEDFKTIEYTLSEKLAVLKLNRAEKRNALNKEMINELIQFFTSLRTNKNIVLLQIVGKGKSYCSGADIEWLIKLGKSSKETIKDDFMQLAHMLGALYDLPQIVVSMAHGSVFGGGLGLLACSDFVISSPETVYSFSEINLGLIPATISPYITEKIGANNTKKLFYSGEKFNENKAIEIGLVDQVPKSSPGDLHYETLMETLLKKPHHALKSLKKLLRGEKNSKYFFNKQTKNCELIADLIVSKNTQELFQKFLYDKKNV
jgi:methylglutaconyl-CoA hydratase